MNHASYELCAFSNFPNGVDRTKLITEPTVKKMGLYDMVRLALFDALLWTAAQTFITTNAICLYLIAILKQLYIILHA